jgi:hypothetical protein
VIQYLVKYRRSTRELLQCENLGSDRAVAMNRRVTEEKAHKDDPDIEVVLLTASSYGALVQTHARYFKNVPELRATLAAALQGLQSPGEATLTTVKSGRKRRKK